MMNEPRKRQISAKRLFVALNNISLTTVQLNEGKQRPVYGMRYFYLFNDPVQK